MRKPSFPHVVSRKAIWLLSGLGGLLLCAGIVALFAFPDALADLPQLLGFRSESRAAELVPSDALMFVSLNPSFSELQSFAKLKPIFEKNSAYADKLNEWAQAVTPGSGVEFERDVLPWAGAELAIALVDVPTKTASAQPTTPNFIFMAPTRDRAKSDAAIARIRRDAENKDWTFTEETYQGVSITSSKPPTRTQSIGPFGIAPGGAFTTFQGWVMYATNVESIKKAIDTRLAGESHSLKRNPQYRAVVDKLPQERAGTLFIDVRELAKQTAGPDEGIYEALDTIQGFGLAVSFNDDGIRLDYYTAFDQTRTPDSFRRLLATYKPNPSQAFAHLPASSILAIGGQDLKAQWDYHSGIWRRDPKQDFQDSLDGYKAQTGVDIDEDLFGWMTGEYAVSVVADPTYLGLLLVMDVTDERSVAGKLNKFVRSLDRWHVETRKIGGVEMQYASVPCSFLCFFDEFGYGFVNGYLVVGTSEAVLSRAVDAPQSSLSKDNNFARAVKPLPQPNIGVSYLSIPKLLALAATMTNSGAQREQFEKEVEPFFRPFKSVSISYGLPNNEAQAGTLFVTVSESAAEPSTPIAMRSTATPSATPTATSSPTSTPRPPTATPTPLLNQGVRDGTAVPRPAAAISAANAERIALLARWGKGPAYDMAWSPKPNLLAVGSSMGVYLYDAETMVEVRFLEHPSSSSKVAFSADGALLASGSGSNVRLWRVSDGSLLRSLQLATSQVSSVSFSRDNTLLASGSGSNVQLWRVSDGSLLRSLQVDASQASSVAFSPDNTLLASGRGSNVQLWRVSDGSLVRELNGHTNTVTGVAFSPDSTLLASTAGSNGITLLWRVSDGTVLREWRETGSEVAFSADGSLLALADFYGGVRLWRVSDGSLVRELQGPTSSMAFSGDGALLATASGSAGGSVRLWRASDGRLLRELQVPAPEGNAAKVTDVAFSADGALLATRSDDQIVRLWRVSDGHLLGGLPGHTPAVRSVAFNADGSRLASGGDDKSVRLLSASDGSLLRQLKGSTYPAVFSPNGAQLASWGDDNNVQLWQVSDGSLLRDLKGRSGTVSSVAFNADGTQLATGAYDGSVRLWRVSDGSLLRELKGNPAYVWSVTFSRDGTLLASGAADGMKLWRVSDSRLLQSLQVSRYGVSKVTFSVDGSLLVTTSEDGVRLWQVSNGSLLRELEDSNGGVTFSADGSLFASGGVDNSVRLWRVSDGSLVHVLKGHTSYVGSVAFSADGTLLASGSADSSVRLWRVSDGSLARELYGHTSMVTSVAFSTDGSLLVSGSGDGTIVLWGVAP